MRSLKLNIDHFLAENANNDHGDDPTPTGAALAIPPTLNEGAANDNAGPVAIPCEPVDNDVRELGAGDLNTQWATEIKRLKGQSPLAMWLTIWTLHRIAWANKRAARANAESEIPTLENFHLAVAREIGVSDKTVNRYRKTVTDLIELLGEAIVKSLAETPKVAFDTALLERLTAIKSRDAALEILRAREATDGESVAMAAYDDAMKAQEVARNRERLAELTAAMSGGTAANDTVPLGNRNVVSYGDALSELRKLPDDYFQCSGTSPPFYGLRGYGHPLWWGGDPQCKHNKDQKHAPIRSFIERAEGETFSCAKCGAWFGELGQEPTIDGVTGADLFLAHMVEIYREVRRVTRPDGVAWIEIGDTRGDDGNLMMIPARLALALQKDGWILRDEITWSKTTSMPETVTDRCARTHSTIYMFAKSRDYYYDHVAVKEPAQGGTHTGSGAKIARAGGGNRNNASFMGSIHARSVSVRNRRSVWSEPTGKCRFAHTSTFPEWIPETWILASTSRKGACAKCGAPWAAKYYQPLAMGRPTGRTKCKNSNVERAAGFNRASMLAAATMPPPELIGWEPTCECGCADVVPCIVADIFAGTGTTLAVAKRLGCDYVGVELDRENSDAIGIRLAEVDTAKRKVSGSRKVH